MSPGEVGCVEVALFDVPGDDSVEKKGNYHNPTRQREIFGHAAEPAKHDPSLTFRVAISKKTQLQMLPAGVFSPSFSSQAFASASCESSNSDSGAAFS